ncbi:hypothetical protein FE772_15490 [Lysobacter enzymogenes]|nr:hypothetical protein [Lysobacter enzymogenes]QCW26838.1 hypothetical protein FE772_15490 [Lysobacter enzymogenes]
MPAAEWTVRWWRWANNAFPDGLAPYRDRDGRLCATGQDEHGPVWFLAGTDGSFAAQRRCRVPAGAHLLVPVINMYFHAPTAGPHAMDCAEVKRAAAVNNDYLASAVVLLDGKPLARPLRLASRCFDPQAARAHPGPRRPLPRGRRRLLAAAAAAGARAAPAQRRRQLRQPVRLGVRAHAAELRIPIAGRRPGDLTGRSTPPRPGAAPIGAALATAPAKPTARTMG